MINLPLRYERLSNGTEIGIYERQMPWGRNQRIEFICKNGIPVSLPFETIESVDDDYHVRFGSYEGMLDNQGRLASALSPDYNADTIGGLVNDFTEAYLEQARKGLLQAMEENDSPLDIFISSARIRARYEQGAS